jgi:hypothetical protein
VKQDKRVGAEKKVEVSGVILDAVVNVFGILRLVKITYMVWVFVNTVSDKSPLLPYRRMERQKLCGVMTKGASISRAQICNNTVKIRIFHKGLTSS